MASSLACLCYVLLSFSEVEHMRQVHPWQTLMTSGKVPLLGAPKFCHTLLHPAGNTERMLPSERVCVCACGCLNVCSLFNNLVLKGKH